MKVQPTVLVLTGIAMLGLTGCGAGGASSAPTSSTVSSGLGEPAEEAAAPAATAAKKKSKHQSSPAPTHTSTRTPTSHRPTPQGPRVVSFKVVQKPKCEEGTAVFRAKAVPLIIKWKVAGADSAELSVDDLINPGTYGPVAREGTEEFNFSCSGDVGSTETHTYTIYTVGGGAQRHKTLTVSAKVLDKGLGTN